MSQKEKKILTCGVCGVTSEDKIVKWCGATNCYLCSKHKAQLYRNGEISDASARTVKDRNEYVIHEDYADLILRNRKQEIVGIAKIDLDDVERCKAIKWSYNEDGYVRGGKEKVRLHRFIMDYNGELDIDHINRNVLDNRKSNLRIVQRVINSQNNSSVGVYFDNNTDKWRVDLQRYGKYYNIGSFNSFEEAVTARKKKIEEIDQNRIALMKEYEERKGEGELGVRPSPHNKWIADFWADGVKHHVGSFNTKEEAASARKNALMDYISMKNEALA